MKSGSGVSVNYGKIVNAQITKSAESVPSKAKSFKFEIKGEYGSTPILSDLKKQCNGVNGLNHRELK